MHRNAQGIGPSERWQVLDRLDLSGTEVFQCTRHQSTEPSAVRLDMYLGAGLGSDEFEPRKDD